MRWGPALSLSQCCYLTDCQLTQTHPSLRLRGKLSELRMLCCTVGMETFHRVYLLSSAGASRVTCHWKGPQKGCEQRKTLLHAFPSFPPEQQPQCLVKVRVSEEKEATQGEKGGNGKEMERSGLLRNYRLKMYEVERESTLCTALGW